MLGIGREQVYNPDMAQARNKLRAKRQTAAERLFVAAYGREMTAKERKKFILEKPVTLKEVAARQKYLDNYGFLRQT